VPLIFLALLYLLHTTGELFLSPVGLSMITKLSASACRRLDDGRVVLVVIARAHPRGDHRAADVVRHGRGPSRRPGAQLQTYVATFTQVGIWGIAAGVLLLLLSPFLKKWMGDVR
jgi:POT family proton-dependent oligopeptide transporter